jgi:hypothetical protein
MCDKTDATSEKARLAFLGYLEFDNASAYRGAILVTDEWGKPLEFRCTAPVKPNPVQRTLYGQTLMPHILVELIGKPLLEAVQEKPEVVVIQEGRFFDLRCKTDTPLICIRRQGAGVDVRGDDEDGKPKPVVISSESGKFEALVIEPHWQFGEDTDLCRRRIHELSGRWDLVEPFERLTKGLEYVHQQKVLAS